MRVRSLGLHSDLALATLRGRVRDREDHLVVTHPEAPGFRGGNFLAFERAPEAGDLTRWTALFDASIGGPPRYPYQAFTWDGLEGERGAIEPFLAAGFSADTTVIMAARRLAAPGRPRPDLRFAPCRSDEEWNDAVTVLASDAAPERRSHYRRLIEPVMALSRRAAEAGHGDWWGAYAGPSLIATLGLYRIDTYARFQAITTLPAARGQGAATALIHHVSEQARAAWGTELFLIEAEAAGPARGLYQRLGLEVIESRVSLTRDRPAPTTPH